MPKPNLFEPTAEELGVFASLPLVSVLNKKLMKEATDLLQEAQANKFRIAEFQTRQAEVLDRLTEIQRESKQPGLRSGNLAFRWTVTKGRKSLNKVKLIENGVLPSIIEASYVEGEAGEKQEFKEIKL